MEIRDQTYGRTRDSRRLQRKLLLRIAWIVLALPLSYAVSSGPVIHYVDYTPPPAKGVKMVETYPQDFKPRRSDYVRDFYRPLVLTAGALHLTGLLDAYLHMWNVFVVRTKNERFFFLVLTGE